MKPQWTHSTKMLTVLLPACAGAWTMDKSGVGLWTSRFLSHAFRWGERSTYYMYFRKFELNSSLYNTNARQAHYSIS